ncbi:MAG: rhodanese-like domain-containing protein [Pirellulaceae bacterium]|jgi:rhodanese-related sulfurtransferase|nr:rhodanese-like domain-containing protein [Pirellulaceae bacterium]
MAIATISPQQLQSVIQSGQAVDLLDVRTPLEFREVHVTGARNVPLDQLDVARLIAERSDPAAPLYVICRSGARGSQACEKFLAAGHANVVNVEGGTMACDRAGLPVTRGKAAFSLQRQVQITAGSVVLLGSLLAIFIHPYWAILAAAVGAGLIYTGVTDSCMLGMLLARMPWNQLPTSTPIAAANPAKEGSQTGASCCG